MDAAAELEPNSSAAMLLWEDVWATELVAALRGAGGELVALGRLPHDAVMEAREYALSAAATQPHRRPDMFRRRGGLVRAAATTAVVAGTAGAVRHHQDQKYAAQDQAAYEQQVGQQQLAAQQTYAAPPPAAPAEPDYMDELAQLAQLKAQGIITDEEFEAKKKQLLGHLGVPFVGRAGDGSPHPTRPTTFQAHDLTHSVCRDLSRGRSRRTRGIGCRRWIPRSHPRPAARRRPTASHVAAGSRRACSSSSASSSSSSACSRTSSSARRSTRTTSATRPRSWSRTTRSATSSRRRWSRRSTRTSTSRPQLKDQLPKNLQGLSGPIAGVARDAADRAARQVLDRPRVQQLFVDARGHGAAGARQGAREQDASVLDTTNGNVVLDIRPLVLQLGDRFQFVSNLDQRIPQDSGKITILQSDQLAHGAEPDAVAQGRRGLDLGARDPVLGGRDLARPRPPPPRGAGDRHRARRHGRAPARDPLGRRQLHRRQGRRHRVGQAGRQRGVGDHDRQPRRRRPGTRSAVGVLAVVGVWLDGPGQGGRRRAAPSSRRGCAGPRSPGRSSRSCSCCCSGCSRSRTGRTAVIIAVSRSSASRCFRRQVARETPVAAGERARRGRASSASRACASPSRGRRRHAPTSSSGSRACTPPARSPTRSSRRRRPTLLAKTVGLGGAEARLRGARGVRGDVEEDADRDEQPARRRSRGGAAPTRARNRSTSTAGRSARAAARSSCPRRCRSCRRRSTTRANATRGPRKPRRRTRQHTGVANLTDRSAARQAGAVAGRRRASANRPRLRFSSAWRRSSAG